ncbi:MAG: hypothetical protein EHM17_00045 [Verrucomicrobiaceae bacterium]|nr:MAG: hypothetical protein EHM17_16615 [Verrucomicrobiaceae bacterium]RPJ31415.1 MAG: hypothetical protein EHM17_15495 [Verrucomicrobiaceae bacterium]RPJ33435.1 MAG: hypothetical protein EHM17_10305 [Verrucomicrobiaceae bacterium]RPJ36100.1 MAG: hypothetical protein EHM17_00045 [Verrucomicrobiaceae bacterium]
MDAAKLVQVYLKMRDAKELMVREHETKLSELTAQMETIEQELLEICKATGQDGGKTTYGSFSKTIKTRYWTNDWDNMYGFIKENDVPQILERRIHQGNFKEFMEANPDKLPVGLNVDSKYSITVRRAK